MPRNIHFLGALWVLTGLFALYPNPVCADAAAAPTVLTLEAALRRSLDTSPDLAAAREEVRAAGAEAQLAGRLPNPELTVSLENVAGVGGYRGTDAAELTVELSQPVELGGKRRLRRDAAELTRQLAANGEGLARADVAAETRRRFVAVLAAQEGLTLAREQAELAEKTLHAAEERIKAGKAPAIDRLRLQGEAGQAGLAVARAERTLVTARQALAAIWGDVQPDFDRVAGALDSLPAVPVPGEVEAGLEQTAAARNRRVATELLGKEWEQARAARIPDPSLAVGWRQFEESGAHAWLVGLSLPLPLFSQGREALAAAGARLNGARARELSARNEARTALRVAWQALADARAAADVLAGRIVPAAEEGFAAAEFGYQAGKLGLLELLDAQRTLFEIRQQMLAARTECHLAAIELHRLQGAEPLAATR